MELLLNQTQLANFLGIAPATMRKRLKEGKYKPVAKTAKGRPLFRKPKI
jgi:DNA-binding XRE family transcriptional regulator